MMQNELGKLIELARGVEMTEDGREEQRRSFAFGNANIENPLVTRETIDRQAEALKQKA